MKKFTHLNEQGEAHMVDISNKVQSSREALAEGYITMMYNTMEMVRQGKHNKGDVFAAARIAGIMAAKKASDIVPLCHFIRVASIEIMFSFGRVRKQEAIRCQVKVKTVDRTGAEIEALYAVQTSLLVLYDMCKAVDRGMCMEGVCLVKKSGGRSGEWVRKAADREMFSS